MRMCSFTRPSEGLSYTTTSMKVHPIKADKHALEALDLDPLSWRRAIVTTRCDLEVVLRKDVNSSSGHALSLIAGSERRAFPTALAALRTAASWFSGGRWASATAHMPDGYCITNISALMLLFVTLARNNLKDSPARR